ncbi:MAG: sensor histidine kinase [Actinomycetota bacterium]
MESQLSVPFHFAAEFLILSVFLGASLDSIRRARSGMGLWSAAQALGFAVLASAQVLHGARIGGAADDGATIGIALRTAGFLLVAVGASSRVETINAMPMLLLPLGLFSAGSSSQLALAPAVAAGLASARGFIAHRRDQDPASFAFTASFGAFAVGEALLAVSPPSGGAMLLASHAARFIGGLLLVRWLASTIGRSVRLRFVAAFVVGLTVLVLILSTSINSVIAGDIVQEGLNRIGVTAQARADVIAGQSPVSAEENFVFNLANAYTSAGAPVPAAGPLSDLACVFSDHSFFLSVWPSYVVKASAVHTPNCNISAATSPLPALPESQKLAIAGLPLVRDALTRGQPTASAEVIPSAVAGGPADVIALISAAPIKNKSSHRVLGALVTGRFFDRPYLCQQAGGDSQLTVMAAGEVIESTLGNVCSQGGATRFDLANKLLANDVRVKVEEELGSIRRVISVGGRSLFVAYTPLVRVTGQGVAVLAVSTDAGNVTSSQNRLNRLLFLLAIGSAALASAIAWAAGGRVTRPIQALTAAAESVRRGDLTTRAPAEAEDEIGQLGRSFNEMAASLDRSTADLRSAVGTMDAVMQSMSDALIATDAKGVVVTANRSAQQMLGIEVDAMIGRRLSDVLSGSDSQGKPIVQAAMHSSSASATLHRGQARIPVAITSAPLREADGESSGRVIVLRDISTEVQAERMKSEFLSNVSHELRTPLTPIKGYTEILKRKNVSKEKAESFLDGILESTERLERIVEILVDFAAMEAGRLKPRTEPVAVKPLVETLVKRWRERTSGAFAIKVPAKLPTVNADPRLLSKSIDELIDNAVKFSPNGPKVEIEATLVTNGSKKSPSAIRIAVRDHGVGIDSDKMPSLFQDFYQVDGSETREFGGLGLGLAYVKRIASVHGGDVDAESKPGKGSVFSLVLPMADTNSAARVNRK